MPTRVEFYYDVVCPYAYLGSTQIEALAERVGAELVWRPFLLGGVLRARNGGVSNAMLGMPPQKQAHIFVDMARWAAHFGVPLSVPASHPQRTVLAMRAILAAGEESQRRANRALFAAYWVEGKDVTDPTLVAAALRDAGLDGDAIVAQANAPDTKAALFQRTEAALARGVFGAPSMFVGNEMFWGQDRLHFVEAALRQAEASS